MFFTDMRKESIDALSVMPTSKVALGSYFREMVEIMNRLIDP